MSFSSDARLVLPVGERDHRQGSDRAPVTLVEYGDYECPHCASAVPSIKAAQKAVGPNLLFVFRNFPLTTSHPHAEQAAEAAESAGAQGLFWQMHDAIYKHQHDLSLQGLNRIAASVGVELQAFNQDLATHRFRARVQEDFMSGVRSGVNGTPTFFINGLRYDGDWDARTLQAVLELLVDQR